MNNIELHKKIIQTLSDNPDLPIKFHIGGDCNEAGNSWFVGEAYEVEVGDFILYGDDVYSDRENLQDAVSDDIYSDETNDLSDEEYQALVDKEIEHLHCEKVIWIRVDV